MTRGEIIAEARSWLGVPYCDRGRSRFGLDCLGLLVMVGQKFDIPHVDEPAYSRFPRHDHLLMRKLSEFLIRQPKDAEKPGLVGLFAVGSRPSHVGIFSIKHDVLHIIHARVTPGVVSEDAYAGIPRREMREIALFQLPGMVD